MNQSDRRRVTPTMRCLLSCGLVQAGLLLVAPAQGQTPSEEQPSSPDAAAVSEPKSGEASNAGPDELARDGSPLRYTIERIELNGNARTRDRVILRYLPFHPNDVINVDDPALELARYRLLGTGFFRDVQFSLRKGQRPGQVVLVVDLVERNTIVLSGVWMGLSADAGSNGAARPLTAYGGLDVAETNLAGTGITLGAALGIAQNQSALRLRFLDPAFLGSPWMVAGTLLRNKAQDFFGTKDVLWSARGDREPTDYAVVPYSRFGGSLGFGRELGMNSQLWFHYRLETISADPPLMASQVRGGVREPIDFDIVRGRSVLSSLRANFQLDTRDHPFLPTSGWFVTTRGEVALVPLGSDYDYHRFEVTASHWWRVNSSNHAFRLQAFAGAMTGFVPFFEQYYVGDFSDFLPARILDLNFDRRPPPNLLGTAIENVRYGHYAGEIAAEYRIPVFRGSRSIFGIDFFGRAGIYGVAQRRDLAHPAADESGLSLIPVDLTANLGFRMDTSAGGFVFAISNVLGFIPVRGSNSR